MDTKAFVQDTVSRSLNKYLELHPDGGVPAGGTEGQALVKKSNVDGDVEWADINIPDGWGVAKSETISVPVTGTAGSFTINISDLGIASVNDYNVVFSIVGGIGSGAWGDSTVFAYGRTTSAINGSVNTVGGDIQSILVSYVVVAKGFGGGVSGSGLPAGGTTGQILAKASNNDGDAYWISNAGSDLVKYERQYGAYAPSMPITQLVATEGEPASIQANTYEIPIVGCLTSIVNKATLEENKEAFTNAITNAFDIYVEVEDEGSERKLESLASSTGSSIWWIMNPRKDNFEYFSYLFAGVENGKIKLYCSYRYGANQSLRASVGSVRLVAKNGNNFGISTGTDPKYIRNLTGMVLDDLEITGSNIPTSWGIAASGTAEVPIVNQVGQFAFSVSGLEITNPDDYNVAIEVIGGGTGSWGDSNCYLWEKSADRFAGSVTTVGSDVDRVDISYTIFAKGYGNNTMSAPNAILESPNGTKYKLIVADDGTLSTEAV